MRKPSGTSRSFLTRLSIASALIAALALSGCSSPEADETESSADVGFGEATDAFPVTVEHMYGDTTIPEEPERIVVVGLTEQDILLELGVIPVATTEWYGDQPSAVWPWAAELLGDAEPVVLDDSDGIQYEKIVGLEPDLIIGTNSGMTEEDYEKLTEIAPTVTSVAGSELYFSDWQDQVTQVAKAVGRSEAGEELIQGVASAYAQAAADHPEFSGLTATFSQGSPGSDGNLYVYPAGLNTDFLADLGFTMTEGLEKYAPSADSQALISGENVGLIDADVIVFATEEESSIDELLSFGSLADLSAVEEGRSVYTDETLAGAIYFMTPLSQKYVIEHLVPRLADAVAGTAPQTTKG